MFSVQLRVSRGQLETFVNMRAANVNLQAMMGMLWWRMTLGLSTFSHYSHAELTSHYVF